ncbi:hypothetical protein PSPO01_01276 [Paraphaeosphaeria sporulosa]
MAVIPRKVFHHASQAKDSQAQDEPRRVKPAHLAAPQGRRIQLLAASATTAAPTVVAIEQLASLKKELESAIKRADKEEAAHLQLQNRLQRAEAAEAKAKAAESTWRMKGKDKEIAHLTSDTGDLYDRIDYEDSIHDPRTLEENMSNLFGKEHAKVEQLQLQFSAKGRREVEALRAQLAAEKHEKLSLRA